MTGIYKITSPSNKIYIGQTINFEKRLKYYNSLNCRSQTVLYRSLLKHGIKNHTFEIIEECDIEVLNTRERYWQDYYDVLNGGLNCVLTKTDELKVVVSEETRNKISKACKGRFISEEHKDILKKLYTGVKRDKIIVDKISSSLKGRKLTDEHKENLKKSHIGYKYSEERRINASLNSIKSIKITCTETKNIWNSIRECARFLNTSERTLSRSLKGESLKFLTIKYL